MSGAGAGDFVARMKADEAFRREVLAAEEGEDRLAFVNGQGYEVTAQELVDVTAELTDEQLSGVTGGFVFSPPPDPTMDGGAR
jgi:predicted ribosomally synthesized peptide with nif11-like leader